MTVDELLKACDEAENGILKTGHFSVIVPGVRYGRRCRVAPGLTGENLGNVDKGTLVFLNAAKVRAWIKKNAKELGVKDDDGSNIQSEAGQEGLLPNASLGDEKAN